MKVLFYAVNGLGLGHVTRLLAIAREMKKIQKDIQILFYTSSEAENVIYQEGFAAFKVPSKKAALINHFSPSEHIKLLQLTFPVMISGFHPDILVVDTFPLGYVHELDSPLSWSGTKKVFIYRQRKENKTLDKHFLKSLKRYDKIIVPHQNDCYGVYIPQKVNAVYTGEILIRSKEEILPKDAALKRLGIKNDRKNVLITLGGGGDDSLSDIIPKIVQEIKSFPLNVFIASGVLLNGFTQPEDCRLIENYFPLCELYNAFDFVISGCGYNSVNELLYFHKPSVYLPLERGIDDQFQRAGYIHDNALGFMANTPEETGYYLNLLTNQDLYSIFQKNLQKLNLKNNAKFAAKEILKTVK